MYSYTGHIDIDKQFENIKPLVYQISGPQYMEKQDQNYLPAPFLELAPLEVTDHTL